jgi:6-phosphogluconolactonase
MALPHPFSAACCSLALLACLAAATCPGAPPAQGPEKTGKLWVLVGTYTQGKSKGIYRCELDLATGKLSAPQLAAETVSPSFLAVHPSRRFLYAVGETDESADKKTGTVSAFSLDTKTGALQRLNRQSSGGIHPCHLVVDRRGKYVLVANYSSGNAAVLPIEEDGRLGERTALVQHTGKGADPSRQAGPHAHSINLDAANRFAVVADLGLDKVFVYRFDSDKGLLSQNDPPSLELDPKSGPRHFAFHPNGRYGYVINEMASTVTALKYDAERGRLEKVQTVSTLPQRRPRNSTAEVQVHPSGKFVYGSNRGHNSIAVFAVDAETGKLTPAGHQGSGIKVPRNFGIDPTGQFLLVANQDGDSILVFRIDPQTGALEATGEKVDVPKPVCVKFVPKTS